jgi:ArsR family transcriptional regulator
MREDELRTVNLFKVLANPVRYKILKHLSKGECTVSALSNELRREIPTISRHLSILRQNQLVRFRTERSHVFYRIKKEEVLLLLKKANEIVKRK